MNDTALAPAGKPRRIRLSVTPAEMSTLMCGLAAMRAAIERGGEPVRHRLVRDARKNNVEPPLLNDRDLEAFADKLAAQARLN